MKASKILLINPPWISKDQNIWHGIKSAMPPLGLLSVASYIESKGYDVEVLDAHVEKLSSKEVFARIQESNPKYIGLSVMTATSNAANLIANIAKEAAPDATVVFGGVHAEAMPVESLSNSSVDIVVSGDGEETMLEIIEGKPITDILGVSYRKENCVIQNSPRPVEMNLDKYPFPAYHLVKMDKYYPAIGAYKRLPAINMLMTRGCPGKCTFCNSALTTLRTRSAEHVVNEIKMLWETYNIKEIQFYDDTFTIMKKNVFKFCDLMIEADMDISWCAFVRADCFNEALAKRMKQAGCHQILIGVESGDEQILKNIRKPIDCERIAEAVRIARDNGIDSRCAFIFGNMGETVETLKKTIQFSIDLDPDIALYNICTPYPGTQLFKWARENNRLVSEEWSDYELSGFLMNLETIETEEIYKYYKDAHRNFYLRPIAMWRRICKISRISHISDLIHAFFYIVLRKKLGTRGLVRSEWAHATKHDFMDLVLENKEYTALTYELRQREFISPTSKVYTIDKADFETESCQNAESAL